MPSGVTTNQLWLDGPSHLYYPNFHFCCGCSLGLEAVHSSRALWLLKIGDVDIKASFVATPTGASTFIEALTTNGTNIQTSVAASKRRFIDERRDQPFDKRLRFSVRQTESAYRYRDIVVRKQDGFTHILLSTKSSENNSLNPEVRTVRLFWGWCREVWWSRVLTEALMAVLT